MQNHYIILFLDNLGNNLLDRLDLDQPSSSYRINNYAPAVRHCFWLRLEVKIKAPAFRYATPICQPEACFLPERSVDTSLNILPNYAIKNRCQLFNLLLEAAF